MESDQTPCSIEPCLFGRGGGKYEGEEVSRGGVWGGYCVVDGMGGLTLCGNWDWGSCEEVDWKGEGKGGFKRGSVGVVIVLGFVFLFSSSVRSSTDVGTSAICFVLYFKYS